MDQIDLLDLAALRQSEERYRRLVAEDFTGILSIRSDGGIITCNPAFVEIFGFASAEEAARANFLELLRNRKDRAELLELVRKHKVIERQELEMKQQGGNALYVVARL